MAGLAAPADLEAFTRGKIRASDPRAQDALDGVTAAIRRYCGWHVAPQIDETLILDGPGGRYLHLPSKHVTAIRSITDDTTVLVDGEDYRWSEDGSVKRRTGRWTDEYRAITVGLSHGWDDLPDVKQLLLTVAARHLASPSGARAESAGGVSVQWSTVNGAAGGIAFLQQDYDTLTPYRIETL